MTVDPRARWRNGPCARKESGSARVPVMPVMQSTFSYCQQQSVFSRALGNITHNCKSIKSMKKRKKPKQSDTVWHSARTLSRWVLASTVRIGAESVPNRYDVPWTPRRRCTFSSSCWELHPEAMRSMSQYVSICLNMSQPYQRLKPKNWRHLKTHSRCSGWVPYLRFILASWTLSWFF